MWETLGINTVVALLSGLIGFWLGNKRDDKQHKRKKDDEARLRWNDSIQEVKDFLALLLTEFSEAERSFSPQAKRRSARIKVLNSFPTKSLRRLCDGHKWGDDTEDATLLTSVMFLFSTLKGLMESWHEDPSSKLLIYGVEQDSNEVYKIAVEINDMLKFK